MTALVTHLKQQQLLPTTRQQYVSITNRIGNHDPVEWLKGQLHARTPIGTVLPYRAAVKHLLVSEHGYSEDELKLLLPKAKGRPTAFRHALHPEALAIYHEAVDECPEPCRTLLHLLPKTGLRISEACGLERNSIQTIQGQRVLVFRGKRDKERVVPLTASAEKTLEAYLSTLESARWLFVGNMGSPITPHAVRKHTRKMAEKHGDLAGLSPHILRHTYATLLVARGVDIKTIQQLLGHESIETTSRYLHPSISDLSRAASRLELE
jgi:site-specific recombinase XerD